MKASVRVLVVCLAAIAAPRAATAQDTPGSKDHPAIQRFPGFHISEYEEHDFGGFDFPTESGTKRVEGHIWHISYEINEGGKEPSELQILRNYENAVKAKGGRLVVRSDVEETLMMAGSQGELWLSVHAWTDRIDLEIVQTAAMKQEVEVTAGEMAKALAATGHIAVYGIQFDTGKSVITPASDRVLDQIVNLLREDTSLKLSIQGHTDNVGSKAANLDLSKRRADAVKAALVSRGIDAGRLTTDGFGDTKPVADNAAEPGRARNRRVELVKQ
jgi:outer membrane protein OmpA-like peptidoglycan-associated protein